MTNEPSRWIPLESNPEVLNSWSEKAGLVMSQDEFVDVYGLDPELLGMVPPPVKAVILLFPYTEDLQRKRKEEDAKMESNGLPAVDPTVIWIKQTISNACGTIGLLHALMNSRITISPESPLAQFMDQCQGITPNERAKLLETTPLFANIHAEAAHAGQTAVPTNLDCDHHFACFVEAPSVDAGQVKGESGRRLIELDGMRAGPIDRGPCEDLLKDVADFVKKEYISQSSDINFSMVALATPVN